MALKAAVAAIVLLSTVPASANAAGDKYTIDHEHVSVNFTMQHSKWAKYQGTIRTIAGEIVFDRSDISRSSVTVEMAAKSVDTLDKARDAELQNFMNVSDFPKISFVSTSAEKTGDNKGEIIGNLSMAGVTKPVRLDVTFDGEGTSSWDGRMRVGFSAAGKLNTDDFGLTGISGMDIGPELDFTIEVEAYK